MKVLITGANGQVGRELLRHGQGHELLPLTSEKLDITDPDAVSRAIAVLHPGVVINAAAYTAVDKAEAEPDRAFAVNRDGPANLARACARIRIPLIHISTDYVFDGTKNAPYLENDPVHPLGAYGKSKAAGEMAVQTLCPRHVVLRTSWVFSPHGNNFVKTILGISRDREELRVVADQIGCPTSASALAEAVYHILGRLDQGIPGIYHFAQPEPVSWYGFAQAILEEGKRHMKLKARRIVPVTTEDYPTAARRPARTVLDCSKVQGVFDIRPVSWKVALKDVIRELSLNA